MVFLAPSPLTLSEITIPTLRHVDGVFPQAGVDEPGSADGATKHHARPDLEPGEVLPELVAGNLPATPGGAPNARKVRCFVSNGGQGTQRTYGEHLESVYIDLLPVRG